jgi:3-methyladenine DNA glycosylase AlkD
MENIISEIRQELVRQSDQQTQASSRNFFKEEITCYGVKSAIVARIGKEYFNVIRDKTKSDIFDLCDILWRSGFLEESFIACNWSYAIHKKYEPEDFRVFERWIHDYVKNWASCDTLCNHTVGEFVEMYPGYLSELKKFARSDNRWVRRASAVTLIIPARKGRFLNDLLELADILLPDKDDLVQKGCGWLLKAASESHQQVIFDYVVRHKKTMPRTTLRYAIEKMPKEMKAIAMEK